MLARADIDGPRMASALVTVVPAMKKALRRWDVPLIGSVSIDGGLTMLYVEGERLLKPRPVKP
jgi:hypothetical protein